MQDVSVEIVVEIFFKTAAVRIGLLDFYKFEILTINRYIQRAKIRCLAKFHGDRSNYC